MMSPVTITSQRMFPQSEPSAFDPHGCLRFQGDLAESGTDEGNPRRGAVLHLHLDVTSGAIPPGDDHVEPRRIEIGARDCRLFGAFWRRVDRRLPGCLSGGVNHEHLVACQQADLDDGQQQEDHEGEDEGQFDCRLAPVPMPRRFTSPCR